MAQKSSKFDLQPNVECDTLEIFTVSHLAQEGEWKTLVPGLDPPLNRETSWARDPLGDGTVRLMLRNKALWEIVTCYVTKSDAMKQRTFIQTTTKSTIDR